MREKKKENIKIDEKKSLRRGEIPKEKKNKKALSLMSCNPLDLSLLFYFLN